MVTLTKVHGVQRCPRETRKFSSCRPISEEGRVRDSSSRVHSSSLGDLRLYPPRAARPVLAGGRPEPGRSPASGCEASLASRRSIFNVPTSFPPSVIPGDLIVLVTRSFSFTRSLRRDDDGEPGSRRFLWPSALLSRGLVNIITGALFASFFLTSGQKRDKRFGCFAATRRSIPVTFYEPGLSLSRYVKLSGSGRAPVVLHWRISAKIPDTRAQKLRSKVFINVD